MTLGEFKAWFEGFTENLPPSPSPKQWTRVKDRIGEIDDIATTDPVYFDRHYDHHKPWWGTTKPFEYTAPNYWMTSTSTGTSSEDLGRAQATQTSAT